jgi:PAS domain S-box-containing protein
LTDPESELLQRVLDSGAPQIGDVHRSKEGDVMLSFLAPLGKGERGEGRAPAGALIGRTRLDTNPVVRQLLANLRWTREEGGGFVVDSAGRIVIHPNSERVLSEWLGGGGTGDRIDGPLTYESRDPRDNTRVMVYYLPVEGYPSWAVVMLLPHRAVLGSAMRIAVPLLLVQVLLGSAVVILVPLTAHRLMRPLKQLAAAADRIAEGNLTEPVQVAGINEVSRVGEALEGMRARLKERLDDLSVLLDVSQAASLTLGLSEGLPAILETVLRASGARAVRIVFLSPDRTPRGAIGPGASHDGLTGLDRALALRARHMDSPLVIEDVELAGIPVDLDVPEGPIRAAVVLPVRAAGEICAVMWVGYGEVRELAPSELALLSNLASHTAVLVENTRLFQSAEEGRQRLAAILASTIDAVVVTDRNGRVVLVNPAAEQTLGIDAGTAVGKTARRAAREPAVAELFAEALPPQGALRKEVLLTDGRTLHASVSAVESSGGERIGRVSMMRDISHFKQLDEMQSQLMATLSQDLRAPLTFLRGYAMMLPMVGEVNEKQQYHLDKILQGVDQMGKLIDDLLSLERIEARIGLERRPCHLGAILVQAVESARAKAIEKGLTLDLDPADKVAVVSADETLLRQAITNLVGNAIQYTASGGTVRVAMAVHDTEATIRVADTGIGIAASDQARLFEKFYRIRRQSGTDVPGGGLGLAIVKSAVNYHGGRVWVRSELGKGSTFFISLPLSGPESQSEGASH